MKHWRFYHFLSERNLILAKEAGITEGVLPLQVIPDMRDLKKNTFRYMRAVQWLTKVPEFIPMDADFGPPRTSKLPGRKSEYRITVDIPGGYRMNIERWTVLAPRLKKVDESRGGIRLHESLEAEINLDLGNPADWWLFGGTIPPTWFRDIKKNPCLPPDKVTLELSPQILVPEAPSPDVLGKDGGINPKLMPGSSGPVAE